MHSQELFNTHLNVQVMLVSDPSTDKSAASLDVNIGSMSDPKELPGLAHFCEHMCKYNSESILSYVTI